MKLVHQWFKAILFSCAGLVTCLSVFVHPFGSMKSQSSHQPMLEGAQLDAAATRILERSCQDCHSDRTHWPWYSYVAPVSWLVEKDVRDGRIAFDMSRWSSYSADHKQEILAQLSAQVRNKRMPQPQYTLLHHDARLTNDDIAVLYEWAHSERRRLKALEVAATRQHAQIP